MNNITYSKIFTTIITHSVSNITRELNINITDSFINITNSFSNNSCSNITNYEHSLTVCVRSRFDAILQSF